MRLTVLQNLILDLFSCSPTKHLNLSDSVCCTRAVTHTTVWLGMVFVPLGTYSLPQQVQLYFRLTLTSRVCPAVEEQTDNGSTK